VAVGVYEFEYNGYLFNRLGAGARACVTEVAGLDHPPLQTNDVQIPGAHGVIPGLDRLDARTVDLTVDVLAPSAEELYANLLGMSLAASPRDDELPLTFRLDESLPTMRVNCRVRRRHIPLTRRHAFQNVRCDLQFVAADPRIYSDEEHGDSVEAASQATGFSFPYVYPRGFGAGPGEAGTLSVLNAGTAPAGWVATVLGPVTNPTLNDAHGHSLRWEGSLAAGEFVVFDANTLERTVLVGGTSSQYELLTIDSQWFELEPGDNSVVFLSDGGPGTVDLRWRDAWWAAT